MKDEIQLFQDTTNGLSNIWESVVSGGKQTVVHDIGDALQPNMFDFQEKIKMGKLESYLWFKKTFQN